jgi:hypothetical protein
MHLAAFALFAALGTAGFSQSPLAQPALVRSQAGPACVATMDPLFVRHVPPATRAGGNPLLWLIGAGPKAAEVSAPDEQDCVRPIQARDRR